jgi:hypothetical protein
MGMSYGHGVAEDKQEMISLIRSAVARARRQRYVRAWRSAWHTHPLGQTLT